MWNPTRARRSSAFYQTGVDVFDAHIRSRLGSRESRRLRRLGFTPGVIYGRSTGCSSSLPVCIDSARIERAFNERQAAFHSTLFDLVVQTESGPKTVRALPRNYTWTPLSQFQCMSCNWLRYTPTFGVRVDVPVQFVDADKCAPLKLGLASLEVVTGLVSFRCKGPRLPSFLQVSLAEKRMNARIRLSDIILPNSATLLHKVPEGDGGDLLLAKISSK